MITKTVDLDSAYQEIFDEIREKSEGALDIDNIESFFGNLLEITALDKKYLRLPVDEPLFEIDANSRKIDVPSEFKSNGLSVQGDHLAETVFFSIDRYFDYMDLSTCDISINWKMGSETGRTHNFIMNTDIIPGSIVFGWPVNKTITAKSGALSFAVEFCKKNDDDEITYAFNTLASTINIKDGLVVESAEVTNLEEDILSILTNSQFGEGDAAVGAVQWLTGNGHGLVRGIGTEGAEVLQEYADTVNLNTRVNAGVPESIPMSLFAEAYVDANTEIKYMDSIGNNITPVMIEVTGELIEVEDRANLDTSKIYYDADGEIISEEDLATADELWTKAPIDESLKYFVQIADSNPVAYRNATAEEIAVYNTENEVTLYMKLAKLTVEAAGSYIVKAQGQKFDNEGRKIGAGPATSCDPIIVPAVQTPSAINMITSEVEFEDENYSFDEEASAHVVYLVDEDSALAASAEVEDFGALQFVWQKKVGDATAFSNVSEEEVPYILENASVLPVSEEGQYKVIVKNFKNGAYSNAVTSDIFVASELAGTITNAVCKFSANGTTVNVPNNRRVNFNSEGSLSQRNITLEVGDVQIDGKVGELSYAWLRNDEVISTNANLVVSAESEYTPVVKNVYNGSIYTYTLEPVFVNDTAND